MPVIIAYLVVIFVWSTTPLAVKWSIDGVSPMASVGLRMLGGALLCLLLLAIARIPLAYNRKALAAYATGSLGVFAAMSLVYYAAQTVPSGLISVIFGLSPVITGLFAMWLLKEQAFTPAKTLALVIGLSGLAIVFRGEINGVDHMALGLAALVLATLLFSAGSVMLKRIAAPVHPLAQTTGTLILSSLALALLWLLFDRQVPAPNGLKPVIAIGYLAVFGSVVGFAAYFFVLEKLSASQVSLIPIMTPVFALILGSQLAGEEVSKDAITGTVLILSSILVYQLGDRGIRRWYARLDAGQAALAGSPYLDKSERGSEGEFERKTAD